MKQFFLRVILCISVLPLTAQNFVIDTDSDPETEAIKKRRKAAENFSNTLHKFSDPSIVSGVFTDRTWNLDKTKQKKPFFLNATIQPIINISGKRWYTGRYLHALQVSPAVMIRVFRNDSTFNDHSFPVRTPNCIARFGYFLSHQHFWNDTNKVNHYIGFGAFHGSNGQDGYEFTYPDSSINTYNGNFSESVVFEFILGGYTHFTKAISANKKKVVRRIEVKENVAKLYWKGVYEYHPAYFSTPKFLPYHLVGRKRLNLQLGYMVIPELRELIKKASGKGWAVEDPQFRSRELRRIVLNASYIADGEYNTGPISQSGLRRVKFFEAGKRLNVDLTWYERIGVTSDFGIFLRAGYYGSDPYNIYFQESLYILRFGLAYGVFSFGERK